MKERKNNAPLVKVHLSKKERKQIESRIRKLSKKVYSVQTTIPYLEMFKDGICQVSENYYTKTIRFSDIDYQLVDYDSAGKIFDDYCRILNYFDEKIHFQLTFENQTIDTNTLLNEIDIPEQEDKFNEIRKEYADMLKKQLIEGNNGKTVFKYLTFGTEANSYKRAKNRLDNIANEVINQFKAMDVAATALNGEERLKVLHKSLNPFSDDEFIFDWKYRAVTGLSTKDFIAPPSMKLRKRNFDIGNAKGKVTMIQILAGELSDRILNELFESDELFCVNIHVKPYDQTEALKFIRLKLTAVEAMKIDEQKKAARSGYDTDILPPQIPMYIDELKSMLEDLNSKDERLFIITLTIRHYAQSSKELALQSERLKRIANKNNCKIIPLDNQQEEALGSSLILGSNTIEISRIITTSATAAFFPFTTRELFEKGTYYGLNSLSHNMIMCDRKRLKNPNGLFLGTPGTGKSMSVKREILDTYLKTEDDIIICDPEGEYFPLVSALDGQVIEISSDSQQHINPMDIELDSQEGDPIAIKSDFIISLCEIIIGGTGLEPTERSVIDKCVRSIYTQFAKNPIDANMPTLYDLYTELLSAGDIAARIATSLDLYVTGSHNVFSHATNVNLDNRIVCFDIKKLGTQLKKVGMLIVQEMVWNRVSTNRGLQKSTRYYIDEFHLLLKEIQTAKYSAEIWKRFRKWGGIPTGITQNVKDLLSSSEIENIFDNSDFIYLLNQSPGDREILAEKLHLSESQLKYVTNVEPGNGIIIYNNVKLPFTDRIESDTKMYKLMTTKLGE